MDKIRRGEIWLADLNPQIGTETGKTRPVVIIQSDLLNEFHPSTVVCPITTNVIPNADILRIHLSGNEGGLNKTSDIMVDQIRAIDNRRLLKKIGITTKKTKERLNENLNKVLDLNS